MEISVCVCVCVCVCVFFYNIGAIAKETNHSYLCSFKMKTNFFLVNDNAMFL